MSGESLGLGSDWNDTILLHDGTWLSTHGRARCMGPHCCIHNPSSHPLNTAPLVWSGDLELMFRECEHGSIHPDPDALSFHQVMALIGRGNFYDGYHPCCDHYCCNEARVNDE